MAQSIGSNQIDWSSFANNIKSASNTTTATPTNGVAFNLAGNGAAVTFTVATNCVAFVTVNVGCRSTTDFELNVSIWRDGSSFNSESYQASIGGGAGNRTFVRGYSCAVPLTAGAHTLSAGFTVSSATSPQVGADGANITALVLGEVTA